MPNIKVGDKVIYVSGPGIAQKGKKVQVGKEVLVINTSGGKVAVSSGQPMVNHQLGVYPSTSGKVAFCGTDPFDVLDSPMSTIYHQAWGNHRCDERRAGASCTSLITGWGWIGWIIGTSLHFAKDSPFELRQIVQLPPEAVLASPIVTINQYPAIFFGVYKRNDNQFVFYRYLPDSDSYAELNTEINRGSSTCGFSLSRMADGSFYFSYSIESGCSPCREWIEYAFGGEILWRSVRKLPQCYPAVVGHHEMTSYGDTLFPVGIRTGCSFSQTPLSLWNLNKESSYVQHGALLWYPVNRSMSGHKAMPIAISHDRFIVARWGALDQRYGLRGDLTLVNCDSVTAPFIQQNVGNVLPYACWDWPHEGSTYIGGYDGIHYSLRKYDISDDAINLYWEVETPQITASPISTLEDNRIVIGIPYGIQVWSKHGTLLQELTGLSENPIQLTEGEINPSTIIGRTANSLFKIEIE